MAIDATQLLHGRVRGRYFRENFAQAGIDLSQIIPELVTNADAAIAAAGRERGRIQLKIGRADPAFLEAWRGGIRGLRLPALEQWKYEIVCSDDGEGVDAETVDQRLGALGVAGCFERRLSSCCSSRARRARRRAKWSRSSRPPGSR